MAYCTQNDVQVAVGGSQKLIELTDQENANAVNVAVVNAAIAEADSLINSYAQTRRLVPFAPVPDSIKFCSANEAAYILRTWRAAVTEQDHLQKEARDKWLVALAKGLVTPGVDPAPQKSSSAVATYGDRTGYTQAEDTDAITAESLKGFT